jgi:hypothetical protein
MSPCKRRGRFFAELALFHVQSDVDVFMMLLVNVAESWLGRNLSFLLASFKFGMFVLS